MKMKNEGKLECPFQRTSSFMFTEESRSKFLQRLLFFVCLFVFKRGLMLNSEPGEKLTKKLGCKAHDLWKQSHAPLNSTQQIPALAPEV